MPDVHPSAIVDDGVRLADDVTVGPRCTLEGAVTVGPGCRLLGGVWLKGPLTLGTGNTLYPNVSLGFAPQSLGFDPRTPGEGVVIGDGNTFREGVTVHRAMTDHGPTRIGDRNFFMVNAHVGHDSQIGNDCVFTNGSLLGGHCELADRVIMGGNAMIHQFVRVGRSVMFSGGAGSTLDVPPFFLVTAINICGSINMIGMRRQQVPRDQIDDVRWVYRTLYRSGLSFRHALEQLGERRDRPMVREYIEFIEASKRGICPGHGRKARGYARV